MAPNLLNCWHCGTSLAELPLPIGRREECPHCSSSLHVCRMCEFFERNASKMCREPMADEVTDKEQANFCDYYRPRAGLTAAADAEAATARARLEKLFGGVPSHDRPPVSKLPSSEKETHRRKLDALFDEGKD